MDVFLDEPEAMTAERAERIARRMLGVAGGEFIPEGSFCALGSRVMEKLQEVGTWEFARVEVRYFGRVRVFRPVEG